MAPPRRVPAVLLAGTLCCVLLFGVVGAGVASASADGQPPSDSTVGNVESESFDADRTLFSITVREDGSAEWHFRYEQRLEGNETDDFETYAERFNTEETESFINFRERARALTETGTEAVNREMAAGSFDRNARIEERSPAGDEFAVVEMSFVWSGFAETDGEQVIVGDMFVGGLYVGPQQRLRIERGPTLRFEAAEPQPDSIAGGTLAESETVTWVGEMQFTDRQPRVVFELRDDGPVLTDSGSETTDRSTGGESATTAVLVAIVVLSVLGIAGALAYRSGLFGTTTGRSNETAADTDSPDRSDGVSKPTGPAEQREKEVAASEAATVTASEPITDERVLSDEERIFALLESEGGRMKQVEIVERTDWSKSKVSMQLSEMEEEGTISKLRVGRENIVSLAGHEPNATGSPFGDDE